MNQIQQDFKKLLARAAVDLTCSMINLDFEATFIKPLAGKSLNKYQDYQWLVTSRSLIERGKVIHAIPDINSCNNTPWEEWFLLNNRIHHNILYTVNNERTIDEFSGEIYDKDRPLLVLGRKWYHYTDEDLLPLAFQN
jgi:hypothetical protein